MRGLLLKATQAIILHWCRHKDLEPLDSFVCQIRILETMEISVSASKTLPAERSLNTVTLKISSTSVLRCHCLLVTWAEP